MSLRAGVGTFLLSQKDRTDHYQFKEIGWFGAGRFDYHFDQDTRTALGLKYYIFKGRQTPCYWLEFEHQFHDESQFDGLTVRVRYGSGEAVFDVASTRQLYAYYRGLKSDRFTLWGRYNASPTPWYVEGNMDYFTVTDGNSRTDLWANGGYWFTKYLAGGMRYENISATKQVSEYWSPDKYETVAGFVGVSNSFTRWGLNAEGSYGKVLHTTNTVRRITATANYRISGRLSINAGFIALSTVREDGQYWYRGVSGNLVWDW